MPDDENALLEAWKSGDRSAADRLCRRYWPDMLRFFLTATGGDEARAEELAQATFLTVLDRRDAIESSFRAYCYGVARHKRFEAARRWAAEQRHRAIDEGELVLEAPPGHPAEAPTRGHEIVYARRALLLDADDCAAIAATGWCHDLPQPGTRLAWGDPLCSVSASGEDDVAVAGRLARQRKETWKLVEH